MNIPYDSFKRLLIAHMSDKYLLRIIKPIVSNRSLGRLNHIDCQHAIMQLIRSLYPVLLTNTQYPYLGSSQGPCYCLVCLQQLVIEGSYRTNGYSVQHVQYKIRNKYTFLCTRCNNKLVQIAEKILCHNQKLYDKCIEKYWLLQCYLITDVSLFIFKIIHSIFSIDFKQRNH